MEETEYKDNEKVVYKTRAKLSLPNKKPEEVDCLVTEGHVVIEAEKPIKIPVSHIQDCRIMTQMPSASFSRMVQEPLSGTATLTFLDDLNKKRKLSLEMHAGDLYDFKVVIDKQIVAIERQRVGRFTDNVEERPPSITLGKFFLGIKEAFRDHTRDDICAGLQRLGIDARIGERERDMIDIPEGPIRWVNVRKEHYVNQHSSGTSYYTDYGVPDYRLASSLRGLEICSVRVKTFPIFGQVVDLRWEGKDLGLGLISRLNSDISIKRPIIESRDVTIRTHGKYNRYWIISTHTTEVPSRELWDCYQKIAQHLLAKWRHSRI